MATQAIGPIDRIRDLAHKLWEAEGCPEGRADAHWLEAERLIETKTTKPPVKKAAPRAKPAKPKKT